MGWVNEMPAYGLSFPLYVLGLLVVPERDEAAVAEVSILGPFDKFKLCNELRFQPPALRHLRGCQTGSPPARLLLRQVCERAPRDLQRLELLEKLCA